MWPQASASITWLGTTTRLRSRLGVTSYGQPHPCLLCPHKIVDSIVTEVQHQLPHQCHQGAIDLEVPGIHTMADGPAESLGAI